MTCFTSCPPCAGCEELRGRLAEAERQRDEAYAHDAAVTATSARILARAEAAERERDEALEALRRLRDAAPDPVWALAAALAEESDPDSMIIEANRVYSNALTAAGHRLAATKGGETNG